MIVSHDAEQALEQLGTAALAYGPERPGSMYQLLCASIACTLRLSSDCIEDVPSAKELASKVEQALITYQGHMLRGIMFASHDLAQANLHLSHMALAYAKGTLALAQHMASAEHVEAVCDHLDQLLRAAIASTAQLAIEYSTDQAMVEIALLMERRLFSWLDQGLEASKVLS